MELSADVDGCCGGSMTGTFPGCVRGEGTGGDAEAELPCSLARRRRRIYDTCVKVIEK